MEVTLGETNIDVEQSWSSKKPFIDSISRDFASKKRRFSHVFPHPTVNVDGKAVWFRPGCTCLARLAQDAQP